MRVIKGFSRIKKEIMNNEQKFGDFDFSNSFNHII
jgi:hypothetical protein